MATPGGITGLIEDEFASPHSSADDEYESDEPPELKLDLEELKACASTIASATCTSARRHTRGAYHEIYLLEFHAGSETLPEIERARHSCIARLTRSEESLSKATSELATMRRAGCYYGETPGKHLYKLWDGLSLDHKKNVLTQIASFLTRLAALHFDEIGSIQDNGLGPLVHPSFPPPEGKPFKSTLDYLHALIPETAVDLLNTKSLSRLGST
ncbi:hypothetical protein N7466_006484 [Penicillium verhagenii]|uniref:uncharacterized protein n=1 Tax=Penicillium verhagenii TaxID=1562060 RepID=UPI002545A540|nr:uncharacterized protein N7466_006484 [Penicillium verhagenii]KAJ5930991.1 hypothetical protein N7466_006484 [Penicillium verhagenii]